MSLRFQARKHYVHAQRPAFTLAAEFVAEPGFTVLFGPSGAGKSSILDCIAGLLRPDGGHITLGETVLFDSDARVDVPPQHRRAGYVVQDLGLFPHLTVAENVGYGLERREPERVAAMLESFGIAELAARRPSEISGGQGQRVALARALAIEPRVLLLDEPLAGLDDEAKEQILHDLRHWTATRAVVVLYVTHDKDEVRSIGGRVLTVREGVVTQPASG